MIEWKSSVETDMIVSFELSFAAHGAEMAKVFKLWDENR